MTCFIPGFSVDKTPAPGTLFYVTNSASLVVREEEGRYLLPSIPDEKAEDLLNALDTVFIGSLDGLSCFAGYYDSDEVPAGFSLVPIRTFAGTFSEAGFAAVSRAYQISQWRKRTAFCGGCGKPLTPSKREFSFHCPVCNISSFPPVSPAIITAIVKGRNLLLGHNSKFPAGRYSLIAGFVEPGENLEECVRREVKEEVGIEVKNIRYFESQTWPFPHSLMVGFISEYDGGEIVTDDEEITDARWFHIDSLPNIPPPGSISREIIDWCRENI